MSIQHRHRNVKERAELRAATQTREPFPHEIKRASEREPWPHEYPAASSRGQVTPEKSAPEEEQGSSTPAPPSDEEILAALEVLERAKAAGR